MYKFVFAKSIGSHGSENILRFHSAIHCLCPPPPPPPPPPPAPPQVAYDSYCLNCSLEFVLLSGAIENNSGGAGRGGRGERTDCTIGDSRIEDMRLVSDKSLWVLNYLELCHLLLKDWCLLPAMILRLYCKVLHWNLWPHLSGTMLLLSCRTICYDGKAYRLKLDTHQISTRHIENTLWTFSKRAVGWPRDDAFVFFSVVSRLRTPSYVNWCVKCNIKEKEERPLR